MRAVRPLCVAPAGEPAAAPAPPAKARRTRVCSPRGPLSDETREKISQAARGRQHSAETRGLLSQALSGVWKSCAHRVGSKHSPETREKMRLAAAARGQRSRAVNAVNETREVSAAAPDGGPAARGRPLSRWTTVELRAVLRSVGEAVTHPGPTKPLLFQRLRELDAQLVVAEARPSTPQPRTPQLAASAAPAARNEPPPGALRRVTVSEFLALKTAARRLSEVYGPEILSPFGAQFLAEEGEAAAADSVRRYLEANRQFQTLGEEPAEEDGRPSHWSMD